MLKFLCKLVNLTRTYKRTHKGMFFSEHSVHVRSIATDGVAWSVGL